jgi:nitroimidazol reductase NimA-like FMN-containing flavoprotein (pyridoxamine 5'-phosphate oxidase superfamily)
MNGGRIAQTPRTTLRRRADRGCRDRTAIHAIVDEALVAHVGFMEGGVPVVVPVFPWRIDSWLYLHGAANSRLLAQVASGNELCVSVALVDALVLARSALRHSLHYRSVVLFGRGEAVSAPESKLGALLGLIDKLSPGRSAQVRPPSREELSATAVARLRIDEGTAKIAASSPHATQADSAWQVWMGTIPVSLRTGEPLPTQDALLMPAPKLPVWFQT